MPDTQNHPIPLWIQSLLGVAVARREEGCIVVYPVSFFSTDCCVHSSTSCSFLFAEFSQQFQGDWWPGGNPSFEKGGRFFFWSSKVFCCDQQQSKTRETKANPALVDIEYGRKKDLWCILHNVTVTWRWNCVLFLFFLRKLADHTAGLHNKLDIRKFNKAPVNNWVPSWKWPEGSVLADVND